jgi:hypothetical protein
MDEDLYFVDTRNAEPRVLGRTTVVRSPATHTPVTTSRVTYAPPPQATIYPAQYGTQFSPFTGWGPNPMYAQAPIYAQPPWMGQLGGLFGGLGLGDIIKLGADAFAAFKSLPTAPVPTGDVGTDVANNVVYLTALAKDATDRKKFEYAGELASGLAGHLGSWGIGAR